MDWGGVINIPPKFLKWVKIKGDLEGDDSSSGGSTEIDYEAIYQFYKKQIIESIPEEYLEQAIIPEHYADIEEGNGNSEEYRNKSGIWRSKGIKDDVEGLFCEIITSPYLEITKYIYFGEYFFHGKIKLNANYNC